MIFYRLNRDFGESLQNLRQDEVADDQKFAIEKLVEPRSVTIHINAPPGPDPRRPSAFS